MIRVGKETATNQVMKKKKGKDEKGDPVNQEANNRIHIEKVTK
jgi:hypothetical protein